MENQPETKRGKYYRHQLRCNGDILVVTTPDGGRYELTSSVSGALVINSDDTIGIVLESATNIYLNRMVVVR